MLEAAKANNPPQVAESLHLGVTPLGLAYALCSGWAETSFYGDMRLRGARDDVTDDVDGMLRQQVEAQGVEPASWHLPVFCCDELQSARAMPMFLSRKALAETWLMSGRKLSDMPEQQAVMDLRVLVAQMQTDAFAWESLHFITSRKAISQVKDAKRAAVRARAPGAALPGVAEGGGAEEDGPPPLEADDEPPPLGKEVD